MRFVSLLLTLCLFVSCNKPPPTGLKLSDLPTALHSRSISDIESHYVEIVISVGKSEIFHQGKQIATTTTPNELLSVLKKVREANKKISFTTPLLISAPGSTPFDVITENIQTAANSGIYQILFLIRTEQTSTPNVVSIELPKFGDALPKFEPYFLQMTAEGNIYSGTGRNRTQFEGDSQDQKLNKLSAQLDLYSSACKSAGISNAQCQIYVDPKTPYQRVIDIISLTNKYRIKLFFTSRLPEQEIEVPIKPSRPISCGTSYTKRSKEIIIHNHISPVQP